VKDGTGDLVLDRLIERLNELKRERDQCRHITDDTKEQDKGLKELLRHIANREWFLAQGHQPPPESFGRPALPPAIHKIDSEDYGENSRP
jgi:hypothetical protein